MDNSTKYSDIASALLSSEISPGIEGDGMRIVSVGHALFAATMIAVGVMGLGEGNFAPIWHMVPKGLPGREALVYLSAVVSLASGIGLFWKRTAAISARLLLAYLVLWVFVFRLRDIVAAPAVLGAWYATVETAVFIAGAWVLYAWFATDRDRQWLPLATGDSGVGIARMLFGSALVFFGASHFVYVSLTTPLVPGWLPAHLFWAYFFGCTYIAAGLAVFIGAYARLAASLATVQMGLFTVLVWVPKIASDHISTRNWSEFVVSWTLMVSGWMIADSYRGSSWAGWRTRKRAQPAPGANLMKALAVFSVFTMLVFASRAHGAPADLKPVAPAAVRAQIASLASHVERFDPLLKKPEARQKFITTAHRLQASVSAPIPTWRAWLLQQKLLRTLNDPHLTLYPIRLENQMLPVSIDWVSDGILISPNRWAHSKPFPKDSQLLKIGPYTPSALLKKRESLFPGPAGWVKEAKYLPAYYLRWIGVVNAKGDVKVKIRTPQGALKRLSLALVTLPRNWIERLSRHNAKTWYSWHVDARDDVGWFTLRQMNFTKRYERAVIAFFRAVEKAGITRVAVDLRQNGGGWSLAEAPFLQYLGVKRFRDYNKEISLQPRALKRRISRDLRGIKSLEPAFYRYLYSGNRPTALRVTQKDHYHGTLYVVTGPGSFSSAMTFAADVKLNNLGKVLGQPCGEALTGTGNVKEFSHPPSKVPFQVPTAIYDWPGMATGTIVQPNVLIPTTVRDVQQHVDPVRAWFAMTVPRNSAHRTATR